LCWLIKSWHASNVGSGEPEIVAALAAHEVIGGYDNVVLIVAVTIIYQIKLETC